MARLMKTNKTRREKEGADVKRIKKKNSFQSKSSRHPNSELGSLDLKPDPSPLLNVKMQQASQVRRRTDGTNCLFQEALFSSKETQKCVSVVCHCIKILKLSGLI